MSKKEIRICDGCGKEIEHIRLTFKYHDKSGDEGGQATIPFGIIDYGDTGWQLCPSCFDIARKNKFELHVVGDFGKTLGLLNPNKHKPKKR